jgi:hypothetical protein
MPHAVEMPSFLSDDTGPMLSNRPPFDLPSHLRQSYEKLNGTARTSSHTSIKSSLVDAIDSHTAGARTQVNGDMLLDTNLSSVPNGRSSGSTYDHKSSRNGQWNYRNRKEEPSTSKRNSEIVERGSRLPGVNKRNRRQSCRNRASTNHQRR